MFTVQVVAPEYGVVSEIDYATEDEARAAAEKAVIHFQDNGWTRIVTIFLFGGAEIQRDTVENGILV
jgi:hypothetical protein